MNYRDLQWTLASASPRRVQILKQVGISPEVIPADVVEVNGGKNPIQMVEYNARLKGEAIVGNVETGIVLAADTCVMLEEKVLGKPVDQNEAFSMLRLLSGRTHKVITGYYLYLVERELEVVNSEISTVGMRDIEDWEIEEYIAGGEPFDKAGGYGIQGGAAVFIERIEGCYNNIVGLPVSRIIMDTKSLLENWA